MFSSQQKAMNIQALISKNRKEKQTQFFEISPYCIPNIDYSIPNIDSLHLTSLNNNLPPTLLHQCLTSNPFNSVTQVVPSSSVCTDSHLPFGISSLNSSFHQEGGITTEPDNSNLNTWLEFPDIPVESSVGGSHPSADEISRLAAKMGLDFLFQETEIPLDNTATPTHGTMQEVFEVPGMSAIDCSDCNKNYCSSFAATGNGVGRFSHWFAEAEAETSYKQRMRWTSELHDLFMDAVETLGGLDTATPKKILGIMNVVGLNIDQVKSHLQKCRKNKLSNNKASSFEEKNATSDLNKDEDATTKSDMEALDPLRMQLEAQKLLREQLEAQRELQLRIQQNFELLRKMMEKQKHNAMPNLSVPSSYQNSNSNCNQQSTSSSANVSSQRPEDEATKSLSKCLKRVRGEK